ncbi:MAG: protein-glutamate O-methyltransferase CheR [Agriterribacter sp.]
MQDDLKHLINKRIMHTEETKQLLEKITRRYGYDFSGYAEASLRRRLDAFFVKGRFSTFKDMEKRILNDQVAFMRFVEEITVTVTEMFRDAGFYKILRERVLPVLATYPFIRIWHAGCATGEEVYSMAIILHEAGLLHKALLYATDINQGVLEKAKSGIFPISAMQQYSENYIKSGGERDFSSYYAANYNSARFDPGLSKNFIFSHHNLVADASFNEFQLIVCRNVLIYFDRELQNRVFQLFDTSLDSLGFLALGSKETLRFSGIAAHYVPVDSKEKIWRKKK